jgi:hypothetical protein
VNKSREQASAPPPPQPKKPPPFVPKEVQDEIVEVLTRSSEGRLDLNEFENDYTLAFGYAIEPVRYGFSSLLDLLDSLKHVVYIEYKQSKDASSKFKNYIEIGTTKKKTLNSTCFKNKCEKLIILKI